MLEEIARVLVSLNTAACYEETARTSRCHRASGRSRGWRGGQDERRREGLLPETSPSGAEREGTGAECPGTTIDWIKG